MDCSKINLECANGQPLPEGNATLVVDSDPFRRISQRCSVATLPIEIGTCDRCSLHFNDIRIAESSADIPEKGNGQGKPGKGKRGFENGCSAFPDVESLGFQGYIVNNGRLMLYNPVSPHGVCENKIYSFTF